MGRMSTRRRRGVTASRIRLIQALSDAGLPRPTQAALAERIADLEELDSAPKDMVSRVFREQPVDPQSIERVARALGVEAHTLYKTSRDVGIPDAAGDDVDASSAGEGGAASSRHIGRAAVLGGLALVAVLLALYATPPGADAVCHLRALAVPQAVPSGRLGILVARFANDPDNRGQRFVADRFLEDAALAPFLTVLTVCDRYTDSGPGDRRARLDELRGRAVERLAETGAHVLLWGERRGRQLTLRLVTAGRNVSPQAVEVGGRPLLVDERYLEVPLDMGRPGATLPDLKKLVLQLMKLEDTELDASRATALRGYEGSIEWLKSSVVADRNLRNSIDADVDPTRWAIVNAQLCYKHRLLGDYEGDERQYRSAVNACEAVLAVRPRREFPQEWAAAKTNLGSAWLRLHAFAPSAEEARDRLRRAREEIQAAGRSIDRERSPQLWAVNRRTLGTIFIRLGELTEGGAGREYFQRGMAELEAALEVQRPEYQPLDWALTQQNICLALYQQGARLGSGGVSLVREAVARCREAAGWLSPERAALSWAMVQNNLAASTAVLAQLEGDAEGLARAAEEFRRALRVYRRDRVPVNWAEVQVNLGELHCNLALMGGDPGLLSDAAAYTSAALQVFMTHDVARYRRYAEGLLEAIDACDRERLTSCRCGG